MHKSKWVNRNSGKGAGSRRPDKATSMRKCRFEPCLGNPDQAFRCLVKPKPVPRHLVLMQQDINLDLEIKVTG